MKTRMFLFGGAAFALMAVLVLAGCGGGSPKTLAKQTYDLAQQALGALFDPAKTAELEKKAADIEKKVAKLSAKDRAAYEEEVARLTGEGLGGLFGAMGGVLEDARQQTDDAIESAKQAADDAIDAARQAADDALKSSGF